jgi:hypothetical protein
MSGHTQEFFCIPYYFEKPDLVLYTALEIYNRLFFLIYYLKNKGTALYLDIKLKHLVSGVPYINCNETYNELQRYLIHSSA